ncbi:MAG: hypothetical protein U0359_23500 [Byssovorax sp.]
MSAMPAVLSIAVNSAADLTTQGIERWLEALPARERAEMKWMGPEIKAALAELLQGALTREVLDKATEDFARIIFRRRRLLHRVLHEDFSTVTISKALEMRRAEITHFLGSDVLFSQVNLAARAIGRALEVLFASIRTTPERQAELERLLEADLDTIIGSLATDPTVGLLRAEVCVIGLFEAFERQGSAERARELGRLALVAAVDAIVDLRAHGIKIALDASHRAAGDFDMALEVMSRMVLCDPGDANHAGPWIQGKMPQRALSFDASVPPAAPDTPRFGKRLQRYEGTIAGIGLDPPGITLRCADQWLSFSGTPDLVDRAIALRAAPVHVVAIVDTSAPLGPWTLGPLRLLRIGPADEASTSPAARTRDILHDWDELLSRLAR